LTKHGFNCPHAKRYTNIDEPQKDIDFFTWPVIVKPVDSAGSKGVTKVEKPEDLYDAIVEAVGKSHTAGFIIEDFIEFESCHSSTDMFTVEGKLCAVSYSDQLFDKEADNPYTPAFIIWPTTMKQEYQDYLTCEIQRLMDLLQVKTGIYNVETCVGKGGIPYIMEVSPRGGGCKIAELQEMAFGENLIENEVRKALSMPLTIINESTIDGHWCEMVVHARLGQQGIFERIDIREDIQKDHLRVIDMSAQTGDVVYPFTGANCSLGDMFLQFDTRKQLDNAIGNVSEWMKVVVK
jgi:biotin carboxylase